MKGNEQFLLVVIQNEKGETFNFKKPLRDYWTMQVSEYHEMGFQMVADWVNIGYQIQAMVLVDKNPKFTISRVL